MPRKRKKTRSGDVPQWVVTYGDMMTLLLCFFILLAAFSELRRDRDFQNVMKALREAFGHTGGAGVAPVSDAPSQSIVNRTDALTLFREQFRQVATADDPGMTGKQTTVKRIRDGLQFTVGGLVAFDPGSAELRPEAQRELARISERLRGKNNKIEVRGHATRRDLTAAPTGDELWDLSYHRAQAVRRFLAHPDQDIDPQRIRVTACADHEPLRSRAYDEPAAGANRRVEIIAIESLVQDFQDDGSPAGPGAAGQPSAPTPAGSSPPGDAP